MPKEPSRPKTERSRMYRLYCVLMALLTVTAGGVLSWQVSRSVHGETGSPLGDLRSSFGPAALFASGRGMILPLDGLPPELNAFLNGDAARFDPAVLPETFSGPHIFGSYADTFPLTHWLLFYCVGWTWRLFGIHHGALHILAGVMGAFTAAALYALFRLGMHRLFAAPGALFTMMLPPFLLLMPSLRDFSKAPFLLLFLAVSGILLIKKRRPAALHLGALYLALVLGTGYGFRQDILICLPVACAVVAAAPMYGGYRPVFRISAIVLLLGVFVLLAMPVLRGMRHESGSVTSHTLFQGLSREAEQTMYFGDASYELLLTPSDPETHAVVNAHARMHGMTEPMPLYLSPAYARAGRALFRKWARTFPADLFARGLASIESVQRLAALTLASPHYANMKEGVGAWTVFRWHGMYATYIEPAGPVLVAAALFLIGLYSRKWMLAAILVLGYFMAYPSLLFQVRHAFYLAFIVPWAGLYVVQRLLGAPLFLFSRHVRETVSRKRREGAYTVSALAWTVCIVIGLALGCFLLLSVLRFVQSAHVRRMAESYRRAALISVDTTFEDADGYRVFRPESLLPGLEESWNLPLGDTATAYIAVSFEPADYAFPLQVRYKHRRGAPMTRQFIVPAAPRGAGETLYFIPVYELADYNPTEFLLAKHRFNNSPLANLLVHPLGTNQFAGIGLRPDAASLFKNIYYVDQHNRLPWLLYLRLTEDRKDFEPYKRFGWEKAVRMLPVEFRFRTTRNVESAIADYFDLLSRFPGYRPYAERIRELIPLLPTPAGRADALFGLSGYELHTSGSYAMALAEIAGDLAAAGSLEQAEGIYRRAVALAPEDLWHQAHLADTLMAQGNAAEAVNLYAGVLKKAPESPYSALQFERACLQAEMAEYKMQFWESLHQESPGAIVPALHFARACEQHQRWEEAASLYEGLLAIHENHPEILLRYGALIALTMEFARGRALMDQALETAPELKPLYITELIRLAGLYEEAGNHAFAEALYWEIASLSPEDPRHTIHLADMLAARGESTKAIEQYTLVLKSNPESPYSADRLKDLLEKTKTEEERIRHWEELHDLHPMAIVPALFLARAYEETRRWEKALALYRRVLKTQPDHPETLLRYGTLLAATMEDEQGQILMDQALAAAPELKWLYEAGLTRVAEVHAAADDYHAAAAVYKKLAVLSPDNLQHRVNLADALVAADEDQEAAEQYKQILKKAPNSPHSASQLDALLKKSEDTTSRVHFWEALCEQHAAASIPWFYLGQAHEDAGAYDAAREAYAKGCAIDPSNPALKLRYGALTARLGEADSGIELLREVADSAPELRVDGARALTDIAGGYERQERYADAETFYREAMLLAPEDAGNSYNLGAFYLKQERMEEALPLLKSVLLQTPESPRTADRVDAIYLARENKEGRLAFWQNMVEKHPEAVIPLYHLGLALEANGNVDEAMPMYQKVLKIQPEMENAKKRLEALANNPTQEKEGS